jgi:hypothetical protein
LKAPFAFRRYGFDFHVYEINPLTHTNNRLGKALTQNSLMPSETQIRQKDDIEIETYILFRNLLENRCEGKTQKGANESSIFTPPSGQSQQIL